MFEKIKLKDTSIQILDLNQLTNGQLDKIRAVSETKTLKEWRHPDNKDVVKLELTDDQKKEALKTKNYILSKKSSFELLDQDIIEFSLHAKKRAVWRIEDRPPDTNPKISTLKKVIDALVLSSKICPEGEWKGRPQITYTFETVIESKYTEISVSFRDSVLIVTIVDPEDNRSEYGVELINLISPDVLKKLKEIK